MARRSTPTKPRAGPPAKVETKGKAKAKLPKGWREVAYCLAIVVALGTGLALGRLGSVDHRIAPPETNTATPTSESATAAALGHGPLALTLHGHGPSGRVETPPALLWRGTWSPGESLRMPTYAEHWPRRTLTATGTTPEGRRRTLRAYIDGPGLNARTSTMLRRWTGSDR